MKIMKLNILNASKFEQNLISFLYYFLKKEINLILLKYFLKNFVFSLLKIYFF
jgi:hypothetical protein